MRSLCWLAATCLACASDDLEVVWSGEHLDLVTRAHNVDLLCAGTGPFLDASAGAIAERLGRSDAGIVEYRWLPGELDDTPCPDFSGGCAGSGIAFAELPWLDHEIVHVHAAALGRADPFVEEGLAEYLGGTFQTPAMGDPATFTGHRRRIHDPQFYATAGRFVAEAVALSSMDVVLDLYVASDFFDEPGVFDALVEEHLGLTMDDIHTSIRAAPTCSALAYREQLVACSEPALPWDDREWTFDRLLQCDDPSVVGARDAMRAHATFELDADERISLDAEHGSIFLIAPCAPGCNAGDVTRLSAGQERTVELPAGRYLVQADRSTPGSIRFVARKVW